jgi:bifunctional non-homologous end joining protein LigD
MGDAAALKCRSALLDGEMVALDDNGVSNFSILQGAIATARTADLFYFAFDLLHLDGCDLTARPLLERKAASASC